MYVIVITHTRLSQNLPPTTLVMVQHSVSSTSVFRALEKALDPLGPVMKEALYLHLARKYGISFIGDYAPTKEIEDALVIIFERGATPLIRRFRENLRH